METRRSKAKRSRDEVISLARYGEITPDEAEAEAKASGWAPFAREPAISDFDPLLESRWTITMAVAWIAWRDIQLVRENSPGFRSQSTRWIFREWNEPTAGGAGFRKRAGWFLETWPEATTVRLSLVETSLTARRALPLSTKLTIADAERELWRSLADGHLVAEALDSNGRPVDIAEREWSYLKLFEEGKRDVLKYDPLDRQAAFADVKLKRDDLMRIWAIVPIYRAAHLDTGGMVLPEMIEPIAKGSRGGFVPFCCALHWIMTSGGTRAVTIDDKNAWTAAVNQLLPHIHAEEVELIGLHRNRSLAERIPGHALATIQVLLPFEAGLFDLLDAPSHINTCVFIDQEHWGRSLNDKLYEKGQGSPTWIQLQVRKDQVLKWWPMPTSKANAEKACVGWLMGQIAQSPDRRAKSKEEFQADARQNFPGLAVRQFERAWRKAIEDSGATAWSKHGPIQRSDRHGS